MQLYLFELEFDGFDELGRDEVGSFRAQLHRFRHRLHSELAHHRIRVSVNHLQNVYNETLT